MKPKFLFGISLFASVIILLVGWRMDPAYNHLPPPAKTVGLALCLFVMASLLIFSANLLLALLKGRKAQSEDEVEAIVVPAMEARECDDRILKWTELPRAVVCGVVLGALCGAVVHFLIK